jgi:hypothetical protein
VQEQGWKLGFCATATVFHHRRDTLRAYWKQQVGYGKAEAILERKWPDKYNAAGYLTWSGRIYNAKGVTPLWWRRGRIYQGTWGAAPYQGLYHPAANLFGELPLLPEWYLLIGFLAALSLVGIVWKPLLIAISILAVTVGLSLVQAAANSLTATASIAGATEHLKAFGISMVLHLIQPVARLCGRFKYGLHPFRHGGTSPQVMPRTKTVSIWSEVWQKPEDWLGLLQSKLRAEGAAAIAGGSYDDWDLEVQGGMLAAVRTRLAVEEHGAGRQMLRFRLWPRCSTSGFSIVVLIACIAAAAAYDHSWTAAAIFFSITFILSGRMFYECALAMHKLMNVLKDFGNFSKTGEMSVAKPMVRAMARHS